MKEKISILYPSGIGEESYRTMPAASWHDLGMDLVIDEITNQEAEKMVLQNVMTRLCKNPKVALFRGEVFEDILSQPMLRKNIIDLLKQVNQLQDFMSRKSGITDSDGVWSLVRRLKEVKEYIICIEQLGSCLSDSDIHSEGLKTLRDYVEQIQQDCAFAELKRDIESVHLDTKKVKSVTLGVNLSEYYDAKSVGVVSLNDKPFTKANILTNFTKRFSKKDQIQAGNDWNENYTYKEISEGSVHSVSTDSRSYRSLVSVANPLMGLTMSLNTREGSGMAGIPEDSKEVNLMEYLNEVANSMLAISVKRLKDVLSDYATVDIQSITGLIPEFLYYILWAEYIEKLEKEGYTFSGAKVLLSDDQPGLTNNYHDSTKQANVLLAGDHPGHRKMLAKNIYNLKLAAISKTEPSSIVGNDLIFDDQKCFYILTGANRGGKTTITQAIGQLYVLAQGGIQIPGEGFEYEPVDQIFTHFPADEDKTMDFGRLGEECNRFREIYMESTQDSLILLNETFSTTSFEEGYYIARDAIRAMLQKGVRTIYNTHMHKLARDVEEMNSQSPVYKAASLIVKTEDGTRSYKVEVAPAQGISLAMDIARKYGVTYEQLTNEE